MVPEVNDSAIEATRPRRWNNRRNRVMAMVLVAVIVLSFFWLREELRALRTLDRLANMTVEEAHDEGYDFNCVQLNEIRRARGSGQIVCDHDRRLQGVHEAVCGCSPLSFARISFDGSYEAWDSVAVESWDGWLNTNAQCAGGVTTRLLVCDFAGEGASRIYSSPWRFKLWRRDKIRPS